MKSILAAAVLALSSQLVTPCVNAATLSDKGVEEQFRQGALRLKYSMFGKGVSGGAELNRLYAEKRWPELVEGVLGKQFVSDLYYFYLGAAAEGLGHGDAALGYYQLALAANRNGDRCSAALDSCRGIGMPETLLSRMEVLRNVDKPQDRLVSVVSAQGQPLAGVSVESAGQRRGASCTTDERGVCTLSLGLRTDEALAIKASKAGMFAANAEIPAKAPAHTVTMRAYRDMMCEELKTAGASAPPAMFGRQVEIMALGANLGNATLEEGGICTSTFKKANYLALRLRNGTVFNENKLTSYQIGANVFDEVVRHMLLSVAAGAPDLKADGYDITVMSMKQNFAERHGDLKAVKYRFYFPRQLVAKHQDKDISGQQLLDGSIILLNDDRVDLKLQ